MNAVCVNNANYNCASKSNYITRSRKCDWHCKNACSNYTFQQMDHCVTVSVGWNKWSISNEVLNATKWYSRCWMFNLTIFIWIIFIFLKISSFSISIFSVLNWKMRNRFISAYKNEWNEKNFSVLIILKIDIECCCQELIEWLLIINFDWLFSFLNWMYVFFAHFCA